MGAEFEFVDQFHLSTDINIENSNFQNFQPTNAPKVSHNLNFLTTADKIDKFGAKEAKNLIAMIKIQVPQMCYDVVDRAIQIHGGMGVSQDTPLAGFYAMARCIRLADGPDEVHMFQLGRNLAKQHEI